MSIALEICAMEMCDGENSKSVLRLRARARLRYFGWQLGWLGNGRREQRKNKETVWLTGVLPSLLILPPFSAATALRGGKYSAWRNITPGNLEKASVASRRPAHTHN